MWIVAAQEGLPSLQVIFWPLSYPPIWSEAEDPAFVAQIPRPNEEVELHHTTISKLLLNTKRTAQAAWISGVGAVTWIGWQRSCIWEGGQMLPRCERIRGLLGWGLEWHFTGTGERWGWREHAALRVEVGPTPGRGGVWGLRILGLGLLDHGSSIRGLEGIIWEAINGEPGIRTLKDDHSC